jgi:hypothetical protein
LLATCARYTGDIGAAWLAEFSWLGWDTGLVLADFSGFAISVLLAGFGAYLVATGFSCATLIVVCARGIGALVSAGDTELFSRKGFAGGATWTTARCITGL